AESTAAFLSALTALLSALKEREHLFQDRQKQKIEREKALAGKKSALDAINTDALKAACEESRKAHRDEEQKLAEWKKERDKLFGSRDVAEEDASLTRAVAAARREKDAADKALTDLQQQKSAWDGRAAQLEKNLAEAGMQAAQAEAAFKTALERAAIADEEAYLSFIRDEGSYESLRTRAEELKKRDTSSSTRFEAAEKALQDCLALHKTDRKAEELELQKKTLEDTAAADREKIGEDRQALKVNEQNRDAAVKLREAYEAAGEEFDRWKLMKELVGKVDGSDLEVFVQALAFQNLLVKANRYLSEITGRYQLVQVAGEVDFKVRDMNFLDDGDDRPVSNMSGGEKFIISLSLALGIAELASRNVSVDSLFLDEGFGTLSGTPLIQAVNALKQLQRSGKMLGIITHVDAVIKEFDQRIEVTPLAGGFSELHGSGISRGGKAGSLSSLSAASSAVSSAAAPASPATGAAPAPAGSAGKPASSASSVSSASSQPARGGMLQGELFG
ncbi:MAG: hypothetical protein J6Y13_07230, partial [Treponema sp.]|nr:hypothetical protein [Treponema sp.]